MQLITNAELKANAIKAYHCRLAFHTARDDKSFGLKT
jgi:hypothetical protein